MIFLYHPIVNRVVWIVQWFGWEFSSLLCLVGEDLTCVTGNVYCLRVPQEEGNGEPLLNILYWENSEKESPSVRSDLVTHDDDFSEQAQDIIL